MRAALTSGFVSRLSVRRVSVGPAAWFVAFFLAGPARPVPGGAGGSVVRVHAAAPATPVVYRVDLSNRARKRITVAMTVPNPPGRMVAVMPAWTPGAYRLEFWAKNVFPIRARCGSSKLRVRRLDRSRWEIRAPASGGAARPCALEFTYEVYAPNLTDNGSHVDLAHAYLNGASVFAYLEGTRKRPCRLELNLPSGFKAFAALNREPGRAGTAVFRAADYDALIDAPVEAGHPVVRRVRVKGAQVTVLLCRAHREQLPGRLGRDIRKIFEWQASLMGGLPFKRYMILIHLWKKNRYAGLEHAASTSIVVPPRVLAARKREYHHLLYVIAHELFHAWNTRRFVPREIGTAVLDREVYSPLLWWIEGTADYYAYRSLLGARIWSPRRYLKELSLMITRMYASPAHRRFSLQDTSVAIWNPSDDGALAPNLYPKSHAAALALDLAIRTATGGRSSLDRVVRELGARAVRLARPYLYGPADLKALIRQAAGKDLGPEVRRLVRSKAAMMNDAVLRAAGLKMQVFAGFVPVRLGVSAVSEARGFRVVTVDGSGPAWAAGLRVGDLVLSVNGRPPAPDWTFMQVRVPGTRLGIRLERRGQVLATAIRAGPKLVRQYWIKRTSGAVSVARRIRRGWFAGRAR